MTKVNSHLPRILGSFNRPVLLCAGLVRQVHCWFADKRAGGPEDVGHSSAAASGLDSEMHLPPRHMLGSTLIPGKAPAP